ncbi:MAG TPA: hypothetical protein VFV51_00240 [Vicinamibacterales bacterium]|nr:hypothetical protein [Vicinamibacterales bacterium]
MNNLGAQNHSITVFGAAVAIFEQSFEIRPSQRAEIPRHVDTVHCRADEFANIGPKFGRAFEDGIDHVRGIVLGAVNEVSILGLAIS